ncbi:unnamed protein product, partial [Linum tenue]
MLLSSSAYSDCIWKVCTYGSNPVPALHRTSPSLPLVIIWRKGVVHLVPPGSCSTFLACSDNVCFGNFSIGRS